MSASEFDLHDDLQITTDYVRYMVGKARKPSDIQTPFEVGKHCKKLVGKPYKNRFNPYKDGSEYYHEFKKGYTTKATQ